MRDELAEAMVEAAKDLMVQVVIECLEKFEDIGDVRDKTITITSQISYSPQIMTRLFYEVLSKRN